MKTVQLTGTNYRLDGREITFFDDKGKMFDNGIWALKACGRKALVQVSPHSMMPAVYDCIKCAVKRGKEDRLSMLVISPRAAVVLCLEGHITWHHLRRITERHCYIEFPGFYVDGRILTVRILRDSRCNVMAADSHGYVI